MTRKCVHTGDLSPPIQSLESYLQKGGVTIIQAAFEHSFFAHPDKVRAKTPWYPKRARLSREHYPGLDRGDRATWNGRSVRLGDNSAAQRAWVAYSGRRLERQSGYSVRHVWGHPWNPDAFTAGWNLCYMPFWAGMLTEDQHQHPELERAIRQAAWDLYFRRIRYAIPGLREEPWLGFGIDPWRTTAADLGRKGYRCHDFSTVARFLQCGSCLAREGN